MMTEKDFWDMFHKKHNPQFYAKKKKQNKTTQHVRKTKSYKAKR
tara:strand:+ start:55 stop:186 length:132 start_codon:yes stop_codon:yes gene_type:complete